VDEILGVLRDEEARIKRNPRPKDSDKKRLEEIRLERAWRVAQKKVLELQRHSKNKGSLEDQRATNECKIEELKYRLYKEEQEAKPDQSKIATMKQELQASESLNAP
jgi:hypothetical protein